MLCFPSWATLLLILVLAWPWHRGGLWNKHHQLISQCSWGTSQTTTSIWNTIHVPNLSTSLAYCSKEQFFEKFQVAELENEKLQEELKSQRQKEAMREQTLLDVSVSIS